MNRVNSVFLFLCVILLISCEGHTGYIDESQLSRISELTDAEWLVAYSEDYLGHIDTFDEETTIYRFERSGNGWVAKGSFTDDSLNEKVHNFKCTFTADNFAVIYMAYSQDWGHWEEYWLIEKLTKDDLWIQSAPQDPAIYPNQVSHRYRLKARRIDPNSKPTK